MRLPDKAWRIPILVPILLIGSFLVLVFYKFPLYLVGFWWCDKCNCRFTFDDHKHVEEACGFDGCYVIGTYCTTCEEVRKDADNPSERISADTERTE